MAFEIDDQTRKDLDIFGVQQGSMSVYTLFDQCRYKGSRLKLHAYLSTPLTDLRTIKERSEAIQFFYSHISEELDIEREDFDFANYYMKHALPVRKPTKYSAMGRKLSDIFTSGAEYFLINKGVQSMLSVLKGLHAFACMMNDKVDSESCPQLMRKNNIQILELLAKTEFTKIHSIKKLTAYEVAVLDYQFRSAYRKDIKAALSMIEDYDVFLTVANVARQHDFSFPEMLPETENCLEIKGLFHPFVNNAVRNDTSFDKGQNLIFITGPNMAGKSTFLKAFGVAVYLAHVGFPVPAENMRLNVMSGLCTTINISDNLSSGYSHFYAEVMRIKYVAERLRENNRLFVIFDELFRGTNVKDAFDGTLAVASAFSEIRSSFFIISSHITEVAEELIDNKNIGFRYFETLEENGHPVYTYKLRSGVSSERLGMYIIKREKIIEMLLKAKDVE